MNVVSAFLIGLLFGLGLIVSGMSNPAKVLGFLDLGGSWDPSLAMVMAGAIGVGMIAFRMAGGKASSLLGYPMQLPAIGKIDKRLVYGSALFGIGWGLAGICPGPALTLLGGGAAKGFLFVAAMLVGIILFEIFQRRRA
jgi:uncharacterized membrane protein YedE/YeeE